MMIIDSRYWNITLFIGPITVCLVLASCSSSSEEEGKPTNVKFNASTEHNDIIVTPIELTEDQLREVEEEVERIAAAAIKKDRQSKASPVARDEKWVEACKKTLRNSVRLCKAIFNTPVSPHYHDTEWLNTCLANARNKFDTCLAACD